MFIICMLLSSQEMTDIFRLQTGSKFLHHAKVLKLTIRTFCFRDLSTCSKLLDFNAILSVRYNKPALRLLLKHNIFKSVSLAAVTARPRRGQYRGPGDHHNQI